MAADPASIGGDADPEGTQRQSILSAISNEMVRIYKDQFGRGPTKTRTHWAGPDVLVVMLAVRAFISGFDPEVDVASEMFVLHPHDNVGLSRSGV